MNIEQIAVNIKDAHGLDMSDEAAITLLRQALSKLAKHGVEPVAEVQERKLRAKDGDVWTERYVTWLKRAKHGAKLYTEAQLIAAQQRTAAWKDAVEDELVICGILNDSHKDPRKAVMDIALWHSEVAVDPAVSQAAIDLQQRTAEACARYCAQTLSPSKTIPDDSGRAWIAGTIQCADGIRNGEWREYL